jgi:hypothetical protein
MHIAEDVSLVAQFMQKLDGSNVHKGHNLVGAYRSAIHIVEMKQSLEWYEFAQNCEREMRKCIAGQSFSLPAC